MNAPRSEFQPNALIIARDTVLPSHAETIGKLLRYDTIKVVESEDLEYRLEGVGVPPPGAPEYNDLAIEDIRRQARKIRDSVRRASSTAFEPYTYDVHLIGESADAFTRKQTINHHWRRLAAGVAGPESVKNFHPTLPNLFNWQYWKPGLIRGPSGDKDHPAALMLTTSHGPLEEIHVSFGYPAVAEFVRVHRAKDGLVNQYSDPVIRNEERSRRTYPPRIADDA